MPTSYGRSVQPGNLVFLIIVAIWAVYLVQHWIRRREHVATARSVDRFSEAMRVLERRTPLPRTGLAASHPPSYAVRSSFARPALVVKRAPAVSESVTASSPLSRSPLSARRTGSSPVRHPKRSSRELMVRRIRAVAFLVTLAAIPVTFVLAVAHVLLWISVAIAIAAFVVVVAGLRAAMKRDLSVRRAARAAARRRYAPPSSPDWGENASSRARSYPNPGRVVVSESGTRASSEPEETATGEAVAGSVDSPAFVARARDTGEAYDVTAYVARPGEPSTTPWSPVPVPPPTYTLKDSAVRPARPTEQPAEVSQVPVPIEVEDDELERLMAQRHRRVVG